MKPILVQCACCHGKGSQPLSREMQRTLNAIRESFPCTASEIYLRLKNPKLDRSAVNNRVKRLMRYGFVKSKKEPRSLRLYFPA